VLALALLTVKVDAHAGYSWSAALSPVMAQFGILALIALISGSLLCLRRVWQPWRASRAPLVLGLPADAIVVVVPHSTI